MVKKIAAAAAALLVVAVLGAGIWARSILATDAVRAAIAAQASRAIGQPVAIGGIGASLFPRLTIDLEEVAIGQPPRIQARTLHLGTSLRALVSRRIEHGSVRLAGARIELPLPSFGGAAEEAPPGDDAAAGAPVEIVSIDEVVLADVEIVSGGRTLRGDVEAAIEGQGVVFRRIVLAADDTSIDASGRLTTVSPPVGEVHVTAGSVDLDRLLTFAAEFAGGAAAPAPPPRGGSPARASSSTPAGANLTMTIDAARATMGGLTIDGVKGSARVTADGVTADPMSFGLFGGRYEGTLALALDDAAPVFRWRAALSGIDVAAATAFAGTPGVVSGTLAGKIDVAGSGADAAAAIRSARGSARIEVVNGIVRNLGLVRNVVIATSMREGAAAKAVADRSMDEPFTRLGATLAIGSGSATTDDLRFESKDLSLAARGMVRLDGSAVQLAGRIQLSDELTKQAGSDLTRYTAEQGRVTLPAEISGPADNLRVRIDAADMVKRAITNRATEEAQKRLKGGLGGLIRRP